MGQAILDLDSLNSDALMLALFERVFKRIGSAENLGSPDCVCPWGTAPDDLWLRLGGFLRRKAHRGQLDKTRYWARRRFSKQPEADWVFVCATKDSKRSSSLILVLCSKPCPMTRIASRCEPTGATNSCAPSAVKVCGSLWSLMLSGEYTHRPFSQA